MEHRIPREYLQDEQGSEMEVVQVTDGNGDVWEQAFHPSIRWAMEEIWAKHGVYPRARAGAYHALAPEYIGRNTYVLVKPGLGSPDPRREPHMDVTHTWLCEVRDIRVRCYILAKISD